jgi:gamma-glutamyltranspeptidase/glutathione hydrolase
MTHLTGMGCVRIIGNAHGHQLMAQVWHGPTASLHGYNGAGRSPKGLSYEEMETELKSRDLKFIPGAGPLPVSVPGAVKGWCDLHQKFGKLEWR